MKVTEDILSGLGRYRGQVSKKRYWVSAPGLVLDPGQLDGPHDLETAWMVHRLYAHLGELS